MKNYQYIGMLLFLMMALTVNSQDSHQNEQEYSFWNKQMMEIADPLSEPNWLIIKKGMEIPEASFFQNYSQALGLGEKDDLRLIRSENDELGFEINRYHLYHNGIPVEEAQYIVHSTDGIVKLIQGKFVSQISIPQGPVMTHESALQTVINMENLQQTTWEEETAPGVFESTELTGELVYCNAKPGAPLLSENLKLAYAFHIKKYETQEEYRAYLDATTGEIVRIKNLVRSCVFQGTADTKYNGNRQIHTSKKTIQWQTRYYTEDCGRHLHATNSSSANDYTYSSSNSWGSGALDLTTIFWAGEMSWEYFKWNYAWEGFNGNNSWVHLYLLNGDQAAQSGNNIAFGRGGTNSSGVWGSLDIVGHEWTHGISKHTVYNPVAGGGFDYERESGAIDESISDILGTMVEFSQEPYANYLIGEKFYNTGNIRDMSDPHNSQGLDDQNLQVPQPKTYVADQFWRDVTLQGCQTPDQTNDFCGVHVNSGVMNYWFFVLAEGDNGTNANGYSYNVNGISRSKAEDIVWRAFRYYFVNTSGFSDAKNATLWAAYELFGACSPEFYATLEAWKIVGVPTGNYHSILTINCADIATEHGGGNPYVASVLGNIDISCNTNTGSGLLTELVSGTSVNMKNGFHAIASTPYHAYIANCFNNIGARSSNPKQSIQENSSTDKSMQLENEDQISIFPNPSNGIFNLTLDPESSYTIELYNVSGTRMISLKVKEVTIYEVDISDYSNGVYVIRVFNENLNHSTKVVKQ
ncbi:MAG: M4 family metallopeptidase [Vicingaceae bacterium]